MLWLVKASVQNAIQQCKHSIGLAGCVCPRAWLRKWVNPTEFESEEEEGAQTRTLAAVALAAAAAAAGCYRQQYPL